MKYEGSSTKEYLCVYNMKGKKLKVGKLMTYKKI